MSDHDFEAHVAVLGLGPAGRSLTHRLAAYGVDVVAVDVDPERTWRPTYAAWVDELPDWLPPEVVSTRSAAYAWGLRERALHRSYAVLDTPGLQRTLSVAGARVVHGTVAEADDHLVTLADLRTIRAEVVVDARGVRLTPRQAQQTAFGVVVPRSRAGELQRTWFMDWRRDNGAPPEAPPSFLYVVPLDADHLLFEETCLVGRPALGERELRSRLVARLAARGIRLTGEERTENVRFAVEPGAPAEPGGPLRIGARGGVMHPATGYSVAPSLVLAETLARAVTAGVRSARALDRMVWGARARQTRALRRVGLTTLLRLSPTEVPEFFEAFFALPPRLQRAYLSDRERPGTTMAAMAAMAVRMRPALTQVAVRSVFSRSRIARE